MIPLPDSPFQYYKNNQRGFTLIELPIIVAVIAILLAIGAPSFLAFLNRAKIVDAIGKVQGALKKAQTEAIRKSKSCSVALNTADGKLSSPCLVTGDRVLPEGVSMVTNVPGGSPSEETLPVVEKLLSTWTMAPIQKSALSHPIVSGL